MRSHNFPWENLQNSMAGYVRWIKEIQASFKPAHTGTSKGQDWLYQPSIDSSARVYTTNQPPIKSTLDNGSAPSFPLPLANVLPKALMDLVI